jgi:predicted nucleotidyltransferase
MKRLDHIQLKANDRQALDAAASLLRRRYPVDNVILYGSKARGTDDAESDIDLLVLTSTPLDWRVRRAMTEDLYDVQLRYGVVISILVVPSAEWSEGRYSVLPIHDEIERYGVAA